MLVCQGRLYRKKDPKSSEREVALVESSKSMIMSDVTLNDEIVLPNESLGATVQDSAPVTRKVRPAVRHRPGDSSRLRHRIISTDIAAALISWCVGTFAFHIFHRGSMTQPILSSIIGGIAFTSIVVGLCVVFQLYRTKISFVPSDERMRIFIVALIAGIAAGTFARIETHQFSLLLGTTTLFVFLFSDILFRSLFRQWLRIQRSHGRFHREILLIGTNQDAYDMYELLRTHPEIGFSIVGVVGDKKEADNFDDIAWCGDIDEVVESTRKTGATGVVIAAKSLDTSQLRHVTNRLLARSIHVHVSSGMFGFDSRRLRPQSFSREPVFYIEPLTYPLAQRAIKRGFDIVVSGVGLILASPIFVISAILIKMNDGGPVLFRQTRIGKNSLPFRCVKLRTMSVDADKNLSKVMNQNERRGPLYKQANDPRRTRIGRILEATSLDELPQLWLVFKGTMSLIGPRPALPHEVAVFDDEHNARHKVRPGITGLWQVEGRDNPSFDAYRRLDLFYVENWSLLLDISILAMTFHVVVVRAFRMIFHMHRPDWARAGVSDPGEERGE